MPRELLSEMMPPTKKNQPAKLCPSRKAERGFSFVEVTVAVVIMGVIANLAVTKFNRFQAKARQTQAKTNLQLIANLEESYREEAGSYADMTLRGRNGAAFDCTKTDIGYKVAPCPDERLSYGYTVTGSTPAVFLGKGISGVGADNKIVLNCPIADEWTIDENRKLLHIADSRILCP
jgi:prepilin-type N-terminal cleavage/methylation domain-containing protein